jgi:hypothetical protein
MANKDGSKWVLKKSGAFRDSAQNGLQNFRRSAHEEILTYQHISLYYIYVCVQTTKSAKCICKQTLMDENTVVASYCTKNYF